MCDDALQKLLNWVGDVENTISNQDVVKEDSEQLRNQINTVKVHQYSTFLALHLRSSYI